MPVGSSSSVAKITPRTPKEQQSKTTSDYTEFLSVVAKSPALITGYSKLLKAAGYYKGKITDKYTPALQRAFTAAEQARLEISAVRPMSRDAFLQESIEFGGEGGDGAAERLGAADLRLRRLAAQHARRHRRAQPGRAEGEFWEEDFPDL